MLGDGELSNFGLSTTKDSKCWVARCCCASAPTDSGEDSGRSNDVDEASGGLVESMRRRVILVSSTDRSSDSGAAAAFEVGESGWSVRRFTVSGAGCTRCILPEARRSTDAPRSSCPPPASSEAALDSRREYPTRTCFPSAVPVLYAVEFSK